MTRVAGTPAARAAAAQCASFAAGAVLGVLDGEAIASAPVVTAVAAVACAALALALRRSRCLALILVALSFVALGALRGAAADPGAGTGRVAGHLGAGKVAVVGTVRLPGSATGSGAIIDAEHITGNDLDHAVAGGILVIGANLPTVAPGDVVEVDAPRLRQPSRRPGPESEATLEREGVEGVATSAQMSVLRSGGPSIPRGVAALRQRVAAGVDAVLPQPAAPLVLGIAFGIHEPLGSDARTALQQAGLIHVLVVSGLKVVMVLGFLLALGDALEWPRRHATLLTLAGVMAYVLVSGAGPAAVRSALMATGVLLVSWRGRRLEPLPTLALVAALMLAVDPRVSLDPGFQLSFLGTAGILLLARPMANRLPGPRVLIEPFATTLAAQVATVPVMAGTFGVVSLVGPAANALILPLLPALIAVGGIGALLAAIAPALGWLPLHVAGWGADAMLLLSRLLTALPGSSLQVSSWPPAWVAAELAGLAALSMLLLHRAHAPTAGSSRRQLTAGVAGALVVATCTGFVASRPDGRLHATVLDTASSPAVLVQTADGSVALVDGGGSPALLDQALGRVLPPLSHSIGLVVVTDGAQRAVAGLAIVPGHYPVATVMAPAELTPGAASIVAKLQAAGAGVLNPAGRAWQWGGARWRCAVYRTQTDATACALTVEDASGRLLVLGDAGTADQEELCAVYGTALAADVVVAPPGGALASVLLATVRPHAIAVPVARGTPVAPGPPAIEVARTSNDGDVAYAGSAGGLLRE